MTRKKVNLTYILNNSARRNTYKKRKLSFVKQLDEITTLCDVETCTVIYSDFDPQSVVWPSMNEVRRLITKYQSFPKADQGKRRVNQETFTRQMLQKIQEKLRRQERENRHSEMTHTMFQSMMNPQHAMSGLNTEEDFKELARVISQNLMEVNRMMDSSSSNPPPPPQFDFEGSGVGGSQQLSWSQDEYFMPPTHGGLGSCMAPNMTCPPPAMEFPPPNMGFEHPNTGFETSYMNFQPPSLEFQPANMEVQPLPSDFQQNNMPYNDPNMEFQPLPSDFPQNGMPYPSNPPPFPHYHNEDMGPHDPSSH
ncbi:agamous-like MADS-box protein AGL80 [Impatiens glandulifera]|uniref:agamous-like MADS-box protein AGL80 n=1 Tax=Impatiens glandulifera TaxID=253017 RepID=UPI001FB1979D|nr:agamous-like MADS-box protein AGL80 [Impatiens glandulifera]